MYTYLDYKVARPVQPSKFHNCVSTEWPRDTKCGMPHLLCHKRMQINYQSCSTCTYNQESCFHPNFPQSPSAWGASTVDSSVIGTGLTFIQDDFYLFKHLDNLFLHIKSNPITTLKLHHVSKAVSSAQRLTLQGKNQVNLVNIQGRKFSELKLYVTG